MVLVDTSVWIRGIRGEAIYREELDRLLADEQAVGHELVFGELLIGGRGASVTFLSSYELLHFAPTVAHHELIAFVRHHQLHGRGVGWIDIHLLASALLARHQLWTADARLTEMATGFGLAYDMGAAGALDAGDAAIGSL